MLKYRHGKATFTESTAHGHVASYNNNSSTSSNRISVSRNSHIHTRRRKNASPSIDVTKNLQHNRKFNRRITFSLELYHKNIIKKSTKSTLQQAAVKPPPQLHLQLQLQRQLQLLPMLQTVLLT